MPSLCTSTVSKLFTGTRTAVSRTTFLWGFDLIAHNGNDLRAVPLEDRKRRLGHLIEHSATGRLEPFNNVDKLRAESDTRKFEGVVAKHKGSDYRSGSGRSTSSWIKVKCPSWREANRDFSALFSEWK